jgi:hypothetical protein
VLPINVAARAKDPERNVPKSTLADGKPAKIGLPVTDRTGRKGDLFQTYQLYGYVAFADGTKSVLPYTHLNAAGRAKPQPKQSNS